MARLIGVTIKSAAQPQSRHPNYTLITVQLIKAPVVLMETSGGLPRQNKW